MSSGFDCMLGKSYASSGPRVFFRALLSVQNREMYRMLFEFVYGYNFIIIRTTVVLNYVVN